MEITRSGSQPSGKGPAEYFTGSVRVDPLFQVPDPGRVTGGLVTFEPKNGKGNWRDTKSKVMSSPWTPTRVPLFSGVNVPGASSVTM